MGKTSEDAVDVRSVLSLSLIVTPSDLNLLRLELSNESEGVTIEQNEPQCPRL